MILIISFEENEHVNQVRQHLSGDSAIVNTEWFPTSLAVDARFGVDGERMTLTLPGGRRLSLDEVHAVWNRRLRSLQVHKEVTDETARLFAWSESNEALQGIWQSMQHCYWMNSLQADEIAQRKIRQLQVARQVGLSIPDTVVTNDPDVAREFIAFHGVGNVIRKAFRNIPQGPHRLGS